MKSKCNKTHLPVILIALLLLLTGGAVYNHHRNGKVIKQLNQKLELQSDTLRSLAASYDSISQRYDSIYERMANAIIEFGIYRSGIDSVMGKNLRSVRDIRREIEDITPKSATYHRIDDSDTDFRFLNQKP